jgi:branched-chain amino acid aminotransferase
MRRLMESAKIYRMDYSLDLQGWMNAVLETIRANEMKACYIRPLVYRGYETLGVNLLGNPVDAAIMVWDWGALATTRSRMRGRQGQLVDADGAEHAARNGQGDGELRQLPADQDGSDRRRLTGGHCARRQRQPQRGKRAEPLIVRDSIIYTPPLGSSILGGITRDSIMTLARELGYTVTETVLPREAHTADECFCWHGGRGDPGPVGGQNQGGHGPPRPRHNGAAARVFRCGERQDP